MVNTASPFSLTPTPSTAWLSRFDFENPLTVYGVPTTQNVPYTVAYQAHLALEALEGRSSPYIPPLPAHCVEWLPELPHAANSHLYDLSTLPARPGNQSPRAVAALETGSLATTNDPTAQVTQHGLRMLPVLQRESPQLFGDIKPAELTACIAGLDIPTIAAQMKGVQPLSPTIGAFSLASSFGEYMRGLDISKLINLDEMNLFGSITLRLGAVTIATVANWFATGYLQKLLQKNIDNANITERRRLFNTRANKTARILFLALGLVFSYVLVGGDMHILLGGSAIVSIALAVAVKDLAFNLMSFAFMAILQKKGVGTYVEYEGKKGFVLGRNLSTTTLIDFIDPEEKIREEQEQVGATDVPDPQSLDPDVDVELSTQEILAYLENPLINPDLEPVLNDIPNSKVLTSATTYPRRSVDPKLLEPFLHYLNGDNGNGANQEVP